jgi:hypothetical protein
VSKNGPLMQRNAFRFGPNSAVIVRFACAFARSTATSVAGRKGFGSN